MAKRLTKWENAFHKHFNALSKAAGHKDSLQAIVGKKGQVLTKKARALTNKQLGYTEAKARAMDKAYKNKKYFKGVKFE